jgi:hypothetical protein
MISCVCLWRAHRGPFGISLDDGHDVLRESLLRLDRLPVLDPAGFAVIAISVSPSQTSIASRIRWITSSGVPTQTMSQAIISSYGVAASFSMIPDA